MRRPAPICCVHGSTANGRRHWCQKVFLETDLTSQTLTRPLTKSVVCKQMAMRDPGAASACRPKGRNGPRDGVADVDNFKLQPQQAASTHIFYCFLTKSMPFLMLPESSGLSPCMVADTMVVEISSRYTRALADGRYISRNC